MSEIKLIIKEIGVSKIADACGISYEAVRRWTVRGSLPRTEWTGETDYCGQIIKLSKKRLTKEQLLKREPPCRPEPVKPSKSQPTV